MSFRFATVSPTCLSSRLAQTRLHLRPTKRHTLVVNRRTYSYALLQDATNNTSKVPEVSRDVRTDRVNLSDEHASAGCMVFNDLNTESAQSIQQDIPSEQDIAPCSPMSPAEMPHHIKEYWSQDWNLVWERLHEELLERRRGQRGKLEDLWQDYREFAKSFIGQPDASELRARWLELTKRQKAYVLPRLLAGSLVESAEQTLFVLSNVYIQSTYNFRIRMQCLRHIHLTFLKELALGSEARRKFEEQIAILRSPETWPTANISVPHLDTLLGWSNPEQCSRIVSTYYEVYPFRPPESLLPIVMSHIKKGNFEEAFEIFKQLPDNILQDSAGVRAQNLLLKNDTITKTETGSNFKFLPQVLARGIAPDASLHNAVIEAAIENKVPEVAWDLYRHLRSNGLELNARSYLVLLRDAFQRGQIEAVHDIMTTIHEDEKLVKDRYLIAYSMNIVRNICFYRRRVPPEESLSHILALYDRAYSREPLYRLRIISEDNPNEENSILPKPTPGSLAFTIRTFILVQYSEEVVDTLWAWIRHLIATQDEDAIAVAQIDIMYNGFILFYARTPQGMLKATQVLRYMLISKRCEPSLRTWNMLLCGFLKHEQFNEADKLLQLMRHKGMTVDQLSERYLPQGDLRKAMAAHVESTLDEHMMPSEMVEAMIESLSLQCSYRPRDTSDDVMEATSGLEV